MNQPLYQQIIDYLQAQIAAGILPVGAQLPTEKELSTQFNVSRITSKRALTELENAGIIERTQGKGSFVKEKASPASTTSKKVLFLLPFANDLSVGNFNAGFLIQSHEGSIFLKHSKTSGFRKVTFGIFTKFETNRSEKYVTGLLNGFTDIKRTVALFIPAVDRRCYKVKASCTFNICAIIYYALGHAGNSR